MITETEKQHMSTEPSIPVFSTVPSASETEESPQPAPRTSPPVNDDETQVVREPVDYILMTVHDDMILVPQTGDDLYRMIDEGEKYIFWTVTGQDYELKPAELHVNKIGEVTGKRYFEAVESTWHIYKIELGDLVFYDRFDKLLDERYKVRKIAGYIHGGKYSGTDISNQKTQDYTVMLLFDDLYAIDSDDNIRMISARNVGGYDYETVEKVGIGDIIPWVWIDMPYATPNGNWLCYLTSREGNFNNIWYLSIDHGTEGRLTDDIAFRLYGTNAGEIAYMVKSESSVYRTLLNKLNGDASYPVGEDIRDVWSENGALVLRGDDFIIVDRGSSEIRLDGRYEGFHPFSNYNGMWMADRFEYGQPRSFILVDWWYRVYIFNDLTAMPVEEWFGFFRHMDENIVSIEDIGEYGIGITSLTPEGVKTWN